jgi:phosphatidate phosphatase APP1
MSMRRILARTAGAAAVLAMLFACGTERAERDALVIYPAYGDEHGAVIEGRVIEARRGRAPSESDSWWRNLLRNARSLMNDERAGARVRVNVAGSMRKAVTDDEGYFRMKVAPPLLLAPGWHRLRGRVGAVEGEGTLLVVPPQNTLGIISDVDDTILVSEVNDKSRLLANSLLKNALQRESVPGAARAYHLLAARNPVPAATPLFYLSASPRQLGASIQAFLDGNQFPSGVLITKRVTNDSTSEPITDQAAYKIAKIEEIFARLPHVRFVLVGDDGERDPEIYQEIRTRHPQRVEAVWIRRVHPDPARAAYPEQGDLAQLLAAPS